MLFFFKKFIYTGVFHFTFFLLLIVGIQNSANKEKVNLIISETIRLPISFIVGISFIGGSLTGSILNINLSEKRN